MNWITQLFERITAVVPRLYTINPDEGGIRITCGSKYQPLPPGWFINWPLIHTFIKITVTPQIKNIPAQSVVTTDGVDICIGAAIRYQVKDASKAILKVQDYDEAIQTVVLGAVTKYVLVKTFVQCRDIEQFEAALTVAVVKASRGWGLESVKVSLTDLGTVRNLRIMSDRKPEAETIVRGDE